jgi:hypothetical protein
MQYIGSETDGESFCNFPERTRPTVRRIRLQEFVSLSLSTLHVERVSQTTIEFKQKRYSPALMCSPLTSEQAFDALTEFARFHGLGTWP